MTRTASKLSDENEISNLNNFDLFSLWLFENIKANRLLHTDLCKRMPIQKATSPSISPSDTEWIMAWACTCDDYATTKSICLKQEDYE